MKNYIKSGAFKAGGGSSLSEDPQRFSLTRATKGVVNETSRATRYGPRGRGLRGRIGGRK